jgi:hypothetical protein
MQKVYCSYVVNLLLFTHSHNPVGIFRNIKFKIVIIHYHIIYIWCPKFRILDYVLKNVMPLLTFVMLTFKYKPLSIWHIYTNLLNVPYQCSKLTGISHWTCGPVKINWLDLKMVCWTTEGGKRPIGQSFLENGCWGNAPPKIILQRMGCKKKRYLGLELSNIFHNLFKWIFSCG